MKQDIRKGIKSSFLYKRFAYNSDGFIELVKFLEDKNLIDKFCEECNFNKKFFINELKVNREISLGVFLDIVDIHSSLRKANMEQIFGMTKLFLTKIFKKYVIRYYEGKY